MVNVTFQQVDTFIAVAERLNLSDTASAMFISQPALSKTISRLEESIGVKLFDRNNRGVSLTKEGAYLYSEIKRPFAKIDKAMQAIKQMQSSPRKQLKIGYPSSYDFNPDFDVIRQVVQSFRIKYPDIEVSELLYEFVSLRDALIYSDIDLMIAQTVVKSELTNISFKNISKFNICIAMSSIHPLAASDTLTLSALENETFYGVFCYNAREEESNSLHNVFGFTPKLSYVPNFQTLIRTISQGKGVSLCGRFNNVASEYEIKYYPLSDMAAFKDNYVMAAWRTGDVSSAAQAFLDMLP